MLLLLVRRQCYLEVDVDELLHLFSRVKISPIQSNCGVLADLRTTQLQLTKFVESNPGSQPKMCHCFWHAKA
jgi:hypothetical protein